MSRQYHRWLYPHPTLILGGVTAQLDRFGPVHSTGYGRTSNGPIYFDRRLRNQPGGEPHSPIVRRLVHRYQSTGHHQQYLKDKHGWRIEAAFASPIEELATLGRDSTRA